MACNSDPLLCCDTTAVVVTLTTLHDDRVVRRCLCSSDRTLDGRGLVTSHCESAECFPGHWWGKNKALFLPSLAHSVQSSKALREKQVYRGRRPEREPLWPPLKDPQKAGGWGGGEAGEEDRSAILCCFAAQEKDLNFSECFRKPLESFRQEKNRALFSFFQTALATLGGTGWEVGDEVWRRLLEAQRPERGGVDGDAAGGGGSSFTARWFQAEIYVGLLFEN